MESSPWPSPLMVRRSLPGHGIVRSGCGTWEQGETTSTLKGHGDHVESVAFSPDGTLLTSGSWDGTAQVWDVGTGRNTILFRSGRFVESVAFSLDGRTIAFSLSIGTVFVWDVATATNTAILEGHKGWVTSVAFSSNGPSLPDRGRMVQSSCGTSRRGKPPP